jgi:hypothetical protein
VSLDELEAGCEVEPSRSDPAGDTPARSLASSVELGAQPARQAGGEAGPPGKPRGERRGVREFARELPTVGLERPTREVEFRPERGLRGHELGVEPPARSTFVEAGPDFERRFEESRQRGVELERAGEPGRLIGFDLEEEIARASRTEGAGKPGGPAAELRARELVDAQLPVGELGAQVDALGAQAPPSEPLDGQVDLDLELAGRALGEPSARGRADGLLEPGIEDETIDVPDQPPSRRWADQESEGARGPRAAEPDLGTREARTLRGRLELATDRHPSEPIQEPRWIETGPGEGGPGLFHACEEPSAKARPGRAGREPTRELEIPGARQLGSERLEHERPVAGQARLQADEEQLLAASGQGSDPDGDAADETRRRAFPEIREGCPGIETERQVEPRGFDVQAEVARLGEAECQTELELARGRGESEPVGLQPGTVAAQPAPRREGPDRRQSFGQARRAEVGEERCQAPGVGSELEFPVEAQPGRDQVERATVGEPRRLGPAAEDEPGADRLGARRGGPQLDLERERPVAPSPAAAQDQGTAAGFAGELEVELGELERCRQPRVADEDAAADDGDGVDREQLAAHPLRKATEVGKGGQHRGVELRPHEADLARPPIEAHEPAETEHELDPLDRDVGAAACRLADHELADRQARLRPKAQIRGPDDAHGLARDARETRDELVADELAVDQPRAEQEACDRRRDGSSEDPEENAHAASDPGGPVPATPISSPGLMGDVVTLQSLRAGDAEAGQPRG